MGKKRIYLDNVPGYTDVDTRSDSTRKGYSERSMSSAAQNTVNPLLHPFDTIEGLIQAGIAKATGQNAEKAFYNGFNKSYAGSGGQWTDDKGITHINPNQGIAPTPTILKGANGVNYIKLPNGKIQSLASYNKTKQAELEQGVINYIKANPLRGNYKSQLTRDPATNINATKGSINKVRGRYSNRNAETANDLK